MREIEALLETLTNESRYRYRTAGRKERGRRTEHQYPEFLLALKRM